MVEIRRGQPQNSLRQRERPRPKETEAELPPQEEVPASQETPKSFEEIKTEREARKKDLLAAADIVSGLLSGEESRYRLFGSFVLALHDPRRLETTADTNDPDWRKKIEPIPNDIDIAVKNINDLMRIMRHFQNQPGLVRMSRNASTNSPLRKIAGKNVPYFKAYILVPQGLDTKSHEIEVEVFADTEIVPKTTWDQDATKRRGLAVLSWEDSRREYAAVADIEREVFNETREIIKVLGMNRDKIMHDPKNPDEEILETISEHFHIRPLTPENIKKVYAALDRADGYEKFISQDYISNNPATFDVVAQLLTNKKTKILERLRKLNSL